MPKIDYKACKRIIERILKRAKQEVELQHKKPDSPEFWKAFENRAQELAQEEKQRLSKTYDTAIGDEFYRLFQLDLGDAVKKA
jgi:hypothetical protein